MSFSRMHVPKGSELLAGKIRETILAGELPAGSMLPSEKELMAQLGLSRATVREGLRLLEAEGLISTRPGRGGGATVQHPGAGGHTRSLATLLQFEAAPAQDLVEAWGALVPVCGRLAARHRTVAQVAELHAHLGQMAAALGSAAYIALQVRFHLLVAHAANNAVLRIYSTSLAQLTYDQMQHIHFTPAAMEAGLAACQAILAAIEAGDGARAEYRIARHLEAVAAIILRESPPVEAARA